MKWYTCPDCGKQYPEGFVPKACENCGCPSEAFGLTEEANSTKYVTVCPDCGKTWSDSAPSHCDNCGCPSENFIKQEVVKPSKSTEKSSTDIRSVIIGIVVLLAGGWFIYYNYFSGESGYSTQEQSSSYSSGYSRTPSIEDYDDIRKQLRICEQKRQKFENEVDKLSYKASMAQYQGILSQKLFWDANDALADFNREGEKLEYLLKKHGFNDMAAQCKRDREYLGQVYHEEKRRAQGYR